MSTLYPALEQLIAGLEISTIPAERKPILKSLAAYIQGKKDAGEGIQLNFICTHNSRRSHLSQIWAQALASYFNIGKVDCFSGGTEATALFPMVLTILEQQGFKIEVISEGNNPKYGIYYSEKEKPVIGFSKEYDDPFNPESAFAAVMTCSEADEGCPFIPGAEKRIPLTFEDPKVYDNTPQQEEKYLERSLQIATEMKYIFSIIH